jgi:anti-sigma factor RsiW
VGAVAVLAGVTLRPPSQDVSSQLVSNHVRALQIDSHLIDVASSDHHTVKPWFAGKVNFAPLVKELGSYPLKGGRVDVVRGSPVAVLVYGAGRHVVDVYMWPESAGGAGGLADRRFDGFNLRHWNEGGLVVWCVSDMGAPELDRFVELWRREQ